MKLKDFLKEFVDHNGMFRVLAKVGNEVESVLSWDKVDMVHEMENGFSRFQPMGDCEVIRLECIRTNNHAEAISIKVDADEKLVDFVRNHYVAKERDISNSSEGQLWKINFHNRKSRAKDVKDVNFEEYE